jgi:hypothetical protein
MAFLLFPLFHTVRYSYLTSDSKFPYETSKKDHRNDPYTAFANA